MPSLRSPLPCQAILGDGRPCSETATNSIVWLDLCRRHHETLVDKVLDQNQRERQRAQTTHQLASKLHHLEKLDAAPVSATKRQRRERERIVYYVQRSDGAIKIGTTWNLETRMQAFRNVAPVELLGCHGGGRTTETALHQRFRHLRLDGEWFRADVDLLAHVRHVAAVPLNGDEVPVVSMEKPEPYALTRQEAAEFLRVHITTIDRMLAAGTIPSAKIGGRRLIPTHAMRGLVENIGTNGSALDE